MPSETAPSQETPSSAQNELPRGLLAQVKRIGAPIPRKYDELKTFIIECKRVLRVTKKPSRDEFKTIVKISAVGMAAIGLLGFVIFAAKELLF
ncbi:protein translocase SEC61 complex subunit gamma [Candidatus Woesearchaeota archaeon]|nr:MAG: protein translocase SEC61 complex subunit gamma [Candidatus Woesearchaeota archaeon]